MIWRVTVALALVLGACSDDPGYPAFAPPAIEITKGAGAVMPSVRIVPVFFPGDPLRDQLATMLGAFAVSPAWSTLVAEYGVGSASLGTPVDLAAAPPNITDGEIRAFLADQLDGSHAEWGAVDAATRASSVYVFYYPNTTTISSPLGVACGDFGAYHDATAPTTGAIYAVIPRCGGTVPGHTEIDSLLGITSHELIEAATDPYGDGYNFMAADDLGWAVALGGTEVGDLCQGLPDAFFTEPGVGLLQREWSNRAAAAFEDPCVPVPDGAGPYLAAIPDAPDTIVGQPTGGAAQPLAGVAVPLGGKVTVRVRLASSAPTQAWTVNPVYLGRATSPVLLELDRTTGHNGDELKLTFTGIAMPSSGVAGFGLISMLGGRSMMWVGAVAVTP